MKKSRVFLLVLIPLLVGAIAGYMVGKRGRSGYSDDWTCYTQRVQIGKLLIFADNDASNFAVIRCVTQDGQTKYRWLLDEETNDEGIIFSHYYGAKSPLKDPNAKYFMLTAPPRRWWYLLDKFYHGGRDMAHHLYARNIFQRKFLR